MIVFITGISKGLGYALACTYLQQGDSVYGISRTQPDNLPDGIQHQCIDITTDEAIFQIKYFLKDIPCIDILINNAGRGSSGYRLEEVEIKELTEQIQLHCIGSLRVTQAVLPKLCNSKNPKIINITSRLGSIHHHLENDFTGHAYSYPYRIAKSAQNMLTICLTGDPSLKNIITAAIHPGVLQTDSGSDDAIHTADDAATNIVKLIHTIEEFGIYHAFGDKIYF